jgi:riboflavin kinase/FMN adenylyltransferase
MIKIFRKIIEGEKRGKIIGFPTLNFNLKKGDKIKRGIWVVRLKIKGKSYFGAANAGPAKTFGDKEEKIEVHLFTKPAGGIKKTEIYFLRYLRKTKKFKTIEDLKKQIKKDIEKGLSFLSHLKTR